MKELELSPRLQAIADQVPQGARLLDVGTDHAYLPVWLLRQGRVAAAAASDVNQGPLERGRETARTYGVETQMTFRCCDGLAGAGPEEADTVVIAGMGGELIAHILAQAPWTREALLLLQPMSAQPYLRQWLADNGYAILREQLQKEGNKFYTILTVRGGESPAYTPGELWAGRQREEDPHRAAYLSDLIRRRERALEGMRKGEAIPEETLLEEAALLADLRRLKQEWEARTEGTL